MHKKYTFWTSQPNDKHKFKTRGALQIELGEWHGPFISLNWVSQGFRDNAWEDNGGEVSFLFDTYFKIGSNHGYYDGPNCLYHLGFLHIYNSYHWCTKCYKQVEL